MCRLCKLYYFFTIILQCVNVFYKFIGHEFTAAYPSCSWLRAEGQQSRTDWDYQDVGGGSEWEEMSTWWRLVRQLAKLHFWVAGCRDTWYTLIYIYIYTLIDILIFPLIYIDIPDLLASTPFDLVYCFLPPLPKKKNKTYRWFVIESLVYLVYWDRFRFLGSVDQVHLRAGELQEAVQVSKDCIRMCKDWWDLSHGWKIDWDLIDKMVDVKWDLFWEVFWYQNFIIFHYMKLAPSLTFFQIWDCRIMTSFHPDNRSWERAPLKHLWC